MRDELHAHDLAGFFFHFIKRLGDLDTTALTTATGMNLRLDDPDRPAQGFSGFKRLFVAEPLVCFFQSC
jgi:hypothetical protein